MNANEKDLFKKTPRKPISRCESCQFFEDDEEEGMICTVNLDMDDYSDFVEGRTGNCPYYRKNDEYGTARKQI